MNALIPPALRRRLALTRPRTPDELHGWCRAVLGFEIPRAPRCEGNAAPFDYLRHAFFEEGRPRDCVVWAGRGAGKTQLGAIATLLDLLFKPGIQVRILGGSLEQSSRMHAYLRELVDRDEFRGLLRSRATGRRIVLRNGSAAEILAQSEASVRGQRVQKLRCDEVELFDDDIWRAAQFVTRSAQCGGVSVGGAVEALSTMHRPFGLMRDLTDDDSRRTFRWNVVDVLERCPPQRECAKCPLEGDCGGRAKEGEGFLAIDDAIQQMQRSSGPAWASEMMCRIPDRSDSVYAAFERSVHVQRPPAGLRGRWVLGMDFGFRAPTVVLWGVVDVDDVLWIVDEHAATERTIEEHLAAIASRSCPKAEWIGIDPAGFARHEHSGVSSAALLRRAGFAVRGRRLAVGAGIEAVRARLRSAGGETRLYVDPRCSTLIDSLERYHYPPDRPGSEEPVKDGPDHACDALRYLVINLGRGGEGVEVGRYG